jgi:3,4-dihydroxy 2-butanone 4-phosphate synthase/GTP cyclohydrolase II
MDLAFAAALTDVGAGRIVLLVDDAAQPAEGLLCCAATDVDQAAITFMAVHGRGLVCLVLSHERMRRLGIPLLAPETERGLPAFGASFEARDGVTTGISAADRATTIRAAVAPGAQPWDIVMPGHIFPVAAAPGGVLARAGLTEAAMDLVMLAGRAAGAVVCVALDGDGDVARGPALQRLVEAHGLRMVSIGDIVEQRLRAETLVRRIGETDLPTGFGPTFRAIVYQNSVDRYEHIALVLGSPSPATDVLVRVHSQCLTGDVLGSERCDCGDQLQEAVARIGAAGQGVIVYMHQEGRGIGLANKLRAYALQDQGRDTVEANRELGFKPDLRNYGVAAQILRDLGVRRMRLLTNNPSKIAGLERYGVQVTARVPLEVPARPGNIGYLRAKQIKMGHLLTGLQPIR